LHLALLATGSRVTAQEIAKKRIIPRVLVRRLTTQLAKAQLLTTTRGNGGGMALARPPREISLLDVVQAMEGPLALNPCTVNPQTCPLMKACPVHEEWVRVRAVMIEELSQATFDKLALRGKRRGA
jgi:Rrf2 family protein